MRRLLAAALCAAGCACGSLALAAPAAAAPLSMAAAIKAAVASNVDVRVARARTEEQRARALESAAFLLPQVTGAVSQQRVFKENLAALGFTGPGPFPSLLGPFDVFDARLRLALNVLDVGDWKRWSEARELGRAADSEEALASEQVAGAAALAYIESLRARESIRAAEAGVALAQQLLRLAQERKAAGTGMGLDVTRAQVREADERLRLLDARTAATEADLRLKRIVGLPLGESVEPTETLVARATQTVSADEAVSAAEAGRVELAVARARLKAAGLDLSARRADFLPKVAVNADYGYSASLPDKNRATTGSIGAALTLPIFDWTVASRAKESRAARDEESARYDDLRVAVEEDARRAADRLAEEAERVQTSQLAAQLARRELDLARGRFSAGVGDNLELTTAQEQVARADDGLAAALASYETARVNLALAEGRMRTYGF